MSDWTTLTADKDVEGSVKNLVNYNDLPVTSILENAQSLIYSLLRAREMKVLLPGTLTISQNYIAIPARFLEPVTLFKSGSYSGEIWFLDEQHFETKLGYDDAGALIEGEPNWASYDATKIYFDTLPDIAYSYRLWYYGAPALLSGSNTTNFLTDRYSFILESGIKHFAFAHMQANEQRDFWLKSCDAYCTKANIEHDYMKATMRTEMYWGSDR